MQQVVVSEVVMWLSLRRHFSQMSPLSVLPSWVPKHAGGGGEVVIVVKSFLYLSGVVFCMSPDVCL